jgi:hypothetical protein
VYFAKCPARKSPPIIYRLAGALDRLSQFGFPLKTNEVTAADFAAMARIETGPAKADLALAAQGSKQPPRRYPC